MIEKILGNLTKHHLISSGDFLIVGVSGGMDSMALLHVLISLKEAYNLKIYVAHLDHGVRGEESERDAAFVSAYCRERQLDFFQKSVNMNLYAKENGLSKEEAGRSLRYEFFEEIRTRFGADKIAVAHNMDDQAETLLFRIIRGTGVEGLSGMKYRNGKIIRPLLNISRREIEEYVQKFSIPYREDETNTSTEYARNRIRLELIPYIRENFNPKVSEALYRLSENAQESNFLTHLAGYEHYLKMVRGAENEWSLQRVLYSSSHRSIRHYVLKQLLSRCSLSNVLDHRKLTLLDRFLLSTENGKSIDIGEGWIAVAEGEEVLLKKKVMPVSYEYEIDFRENVPLIINGYRIELEKVKNTDEKNWKGGKYTKYFAWEKIQFPLKIRNRRDGDRIYPYGMQGSKLLSDLFTDEKIPKSERNMLPLLVSGENILWVIGLRDDRRYSVEETGREVLRVSAIKLSNSRSDGDRMKSEDENE